MARRRAASRPRFRLLATVLLTAAILGLPTAVYAWGRSSSSFAIRDVQVTGTNLVPKKRALRLLRRDYLSHNLFTVTTADVRHSLASLRYVAGVSVNRDFPHTLRVTIVEHRPVAYALSADHWYVVGDDGFVIMEVKQAPKSGTSARAQAGSAGKTGAAAGSAGAAPGSATSAATGSASSNGGTAAKGATTGAGAAARSATLAELKAGPPHAALRLPRVVATGSVRAGAIIADGRVRAALPVIAGLPRGLQNSLDVLQTSAAGLLTLRFHGGLTVMWGNTQRSVAKTLALRAVLARYTAVGKTCTFVDVSTPDTSLARPTLK